MAELHVERFQDNEADLWDEFVRESVNGTIFHRRRFLAYHPPGLFRDASLLVFRGERLVALFPAARVEAGGRSVLKSHPGASYGGFVVRKPPGAALACALVEAVLEVAGREGCAAVELRRAPRIFDATPCDELDYALQHSGFVPREVELSTCLDLARLPGPGSSREAILHSFEPACARAARKALRFGVTIERLDDRVHFDAYWDLLARTLEKHGATPTHSREELFDLKRRFPDEVQLFAALYEGRLIGGLVAFIASRWAAHVFYFASNPDRQNLRPLNLAVLELLRFSAAIGLRFVNFGISTEQGGRCANWGLFRFKEGFGGGGTIRTYWVRELAER